MYKQVEPLPYEDFEFEKFTDETDRPFGLKGQRYNQISRHHGRSLERAEVNNNGIWSKKFGKYTIMFGATSEKGLPFVAPRLVPDRYNHTGVRAEGLVTNQALMRAKIVTEYVNSHGLPTEYFRTIRALESVTVDGEKLEGEALKNYLLEGWKARVDIYAESLGAEEVEVNEAIDVGKEFLDTHDFFTVERDYQVGERFRDMDSILDTEEHTKEVFGKIFKWLNVARSLEQNKPGLYSALDEPEGFKGYTFEPTDDGLLKYFLLYLPKKMGQYLGRFHNLQLSHGFATDHNWSLVGTLYDMDGAQGRPVDEKDPPHDKIVFDIQQSFLTLVNNLNLPHDNPNYIAELINNKYGPQAVSLALLMFRQEYMKYCPGTEKEKSALVEEAFRAAFPGNFKES